eukprot:3854847-Pyramimonas_sp.AAC.2
MEEVERRHSMTVNMTSFWAVLGRVGFDTSTEHGSSRQLGRTLEDSNIRSEQFTVYKVDSASSPDWDVHNEISNALAELGVEKLGVAMIREPQGTRHLEIWREFEKEVKNERIQALGVSNFDEAQMQEIMSIATVPISVQQRQMNLRQLDDEVLDACISE